MNRIWHPYTRWEEVPAGLWSSDPVLHNPEIALDFMRDLPRWQEAMQRVTREWIHSAEQHLSHAQHNRTAWLGQAAVCLAIGQPGSSTRQAWWALSKDQQEQANAAAHTVIIEWESNQCHVSR